MTPTLKNFYENCVGGNGVLKGQFLRNVIYRRPLFVIKELELDVPLKSYSLEI